MTDHVLKQPSDCAPDCRYRERGGQGCPVCDWGLGQCKNCNAAESELDAFATCEEYRTWRGAYRILSMLRFSRFVLRQTDGVRE
jgi:hypothetical protein